MSAFKHHKYFAREKEAQSYLLPHACFHCRKSFKKPQNQEPRLCPQCGSGLVQLNRKFSAPKTTDVEQWKKVEFLVAHGFRFQSVYEQREDGGKYKVDYPTTLAEARTFVVAHKEQAVEGAA